MTGFFETLAARAAGVTPELRPRAAHRFEPAPDRGRRDSARWRGAALGPWSGLGVDDAGAGDVALEVDSLVESRAGDAAEGDLRRDDAGRLNRAGPPDGTGRDDQASRRDGASSRDGGHGLEPPAHTGSPGRTGLHSHGHTDGPTHGHTDPGPPPRDRVRAAARDVLRRELPDVARAAIDQAGADERRPGSVRPDMAGTRGSRDVAEEVAEASRKEPLSAPAGPPADGRPRRGASPEPAGGSPLAARDPTATSRPAPERGQPRRPVRRASAPARGSAPGHGVDLEALLREEVFAALVERGAVPRRERPVVVPAGKRPPPPRPGTAAIRADGVTTSGRGTPRSARGGDGEGADESGPPAIHLHIDRVSVTRAAPAAPAPASPARSPVDHAAYLARRRERG